MTKYLTFILAWQLKS